MALVLADRVKETTTTAGTGTVTLLGASTGFQSFAVIGNTNTTYYAIVARTGTEWEVGIGTYTLAGTLLARTTVLANSAGTQPTALTFSAGTKDVFVTYPSSKSVNLDASGNATALGTPVSATLTNATGLPISTGISGLGTGVATALAVNVGTAGAPVVNGGALGTPSSGVVTNLTGTASININGTVGATTPAAGAFTTLSASGVTTVQAGTAALPAITTSGDTNTGIFFPAADTIAFTEGGAEAMRIDSSGRVGIGATSPASLLQVQTGLVTNAGQWASSAIAVYNPTNVGAYSQISFGYTVSTTNAAAYMGFLSTNQDANGRGDLVFGTRSVSSDTQPTERVRIDSSGNVGIGTSSPARKLHVVGTIGSYNSANDNQTLMYNNGTVGSINVTYGTTGSYLPLTFLTSDTERVRITSAGGVSFGATGTAYGTSGQVLTSGGNVPPTWTTPTAAVIGTTTQVAYNNAGTMAGSANLTFDGTNLTCGGTVTANSDERLKTNWRNLPENFIDRLAGVKHGVYDRTDIEATQVGVSAQSLQALLEQAVLVGEDGILSVAYGNAALVACIQLAQRVVALEQTVAKLTKGT